MEAEDAASGAAEAETAAVADPDNRQLQNAATAANQRAKLIQTRMDEARDWCLLKGDPSLNYYIIADGNRVVFAAGCKQFFLNDKIRFPDRSEDKVPGDE